MLEPTFTSDNTPFSKATTERLRRKLKAFDKGYAKSDPATAGLPPDIQFRRWYAGYILSQRGEQ